MNNGNIKLHFQKYILYYFIALIPLILICILIKNLIVDYMLNRSLEGDYSSYEYLINQAYEEYPSLFKFDDSDTAIIKMDDLILGVQTSNESHQWASGLLFTKEQDQCVGYIIVKKLNNEVLDIDTSHICDMIDY